MDYEFKQDIYGNPLAKFSMGHEALGRWFSDELQNQADISKLLVLIEKVESKESFQHNIQGTEFELSISGIGIEVTALFDESSLDDADILLEDAGQYDDESYSQCGLQDFKEALLSWKEFVEK